ncbi:MAG: DUF177 domain-containing protein [Rhodospirillales bacterium]
MNKRVKADSHKPEFSRVVEIDRLADGETAVVLEAKPEERARLAERFGIEAVGKLTANLIVTFDRAKGDIHVEGTLHAKVVQLCVVTLAPVPSAIEAAVIRNYSLFAEEEEGREIDLGGIEEDEPPEPVEHGMIDLGEAVAEQLALEIDPFPRTPGAEFQGLAGDSGREGGGNDRDSGPFAALARLKGGSENNR